jgi:hypothetical protein
MMPRPEPGKSGGGEGSVAAVHASLKQAVTVVPSGIVMSSGTSMEMVAPLLHPIAVHPHPGNDHTTADTSATVKPTKTPANGSDLDLLILVLLILRREQDRSHHQAAAS